MHTPAVRALLEEYYKERYPEVASRGLALLDAEPDNAELRYIVANSLAWAGHHEEALLQYQALRHTRYRERALLGAGNVNRWNGRPDLAASAYQDVLSKEPDNNDAREGMLHASRELRPRTDARLGRAGNSSDSFRSWATLGHQWRNDTGAKSYEVLAGQLDEDKNSVHLIQRDLAFRYASLEPHIAQVEISAQQAPRTRLFGSLTLKADALPANIDIGHINWGKLAFDPAALQAGLTANRLGLSSRIGMSLGESRLTYNLYRISDGNLVQNGSLHFTPLHQPFSASGIRGFVGLEGRKSRFADPRYWSPEEGHYNALAGINADWSSLHWQSYGSIQYGIPLTGSSGRSWSTGFGMKRWLGNNWAASFDLWAIHTPRDGAYRSHSGILRVENLW